MNVKTTTTKKRNKMKSKVASRFVVVLVKGIFEKLHEISIKYTLHLILMVFITPKKKRKTEVDLKPSRKMGHEIAIKWWVMYMQQTSTQHLAQSCYIIISNSMIHSSICWLWFSRMCVRACVLHVKNGRFAFSHCEYGLSTVHSDTTSVECQINRCRWHKTTPFYCTSVPLHDAEYRESVLVSDSDVDNGIWNVMSPIVCHRFRHCSPNHVWRLV